ncbi:hypothetical protein GTO36_00420, partial [bacterium]|nr:hypothetical protein [bacterium]
MPELTIQALCQQLSGMGYSETAKKLILQARLANLLNLGLESDAEKFYHESGFESGLARSHQRRILEYKRRWKYSSNPTENLPPGTNRCGLLLGCYNAAHNGQRILAAGGHWALNPPFRYQEGLETPLAISINQKDPDRERRAKQGKIPFFSQKARIPLALNNFAGLSVCLTSIDTVTGPKLPPPERIEAFGEMTKMEIVRVCGHDRKEYTPPHANPVLIGFRGLDLRRYIENPKKFDKLQEEL